MSAITLFKVLNSLESMYGGRATWVPGEWMPRVDNIEPCRRGYHLCRGAEHLVHWLGPDIWGVEVRGDVVEVEDKVVASECRIVAKVETWNERTARLFAADCAENVLHYFEDMHPSDKRPREAIVAVRDYANGRISADLMDAARAAARDAGAAATRAAAWTAAGAAAGAAGRDAERRWQVERLREYLNGDKP